MKLLTFAALAFLSAASSATLANTNLVTNGSFETFAGPLNQNGKTWGQFATLDGWNQLNGDKFEIQLAKDFQTNATGFYNSFNSSSSDGTAHYLEINANRLDIVGQTLTTVAGQNYKLSFDYSGRSDSGAGNNSKADVYWGEELVASLNETPNSGWKTFNYTLAATSASTLLKFQSIGPTGNVSYGSYLDAVSVSAVPEPETYGMMLAGLSLIGLIARRKKTN